MLELEVFVFELVAIDGFTARALRYQQAIVSDLEHRLQFEYSSSKTCCLARH